MTTATLPAWDNHQVAHFLCRPDRRVLSQPHSCLDAGVGALEVPVHVEAPVQVEPPDPTKQLSELDTTMRSLGIAVITTSAGLYLSLISHKAQQIYYLALLFIETIADWLAYIIDKTG